MTLPPEIVGKILDHIPKNSSRRRRTLIACALVATWWTGPSQRHLFSSVSISQKNYQRWMNGVVLSGSKARLLGFVRSLWHSRSLDIETMHRMQDLPQDSGGYLSALHNLHNLTLSNIRVEHIPEDQFRTCFSAFRGTLTYLSLEIFSTSFSAFVTLVDYFPNIRTLQLHTLVLEPDEGPAPPLSRPLRGKLHVSYVQPDCLEFFNKFAELELEYEELSVDSHNPETDFLESALLISTNTVKYLKLTAELRSGPAIAIGKFRQLRELELTVDWPSPAHRNLLHSISSTEFRKITFQTRYMDDRRNSSRQMEAWASIDEHLCRLVDRLRLVGYRNTLEAELRLEGTENYPGERTFTKFLPGFREKGTVIIKDAAHIDCALYSSTHNR